MIPFVGISNWTIDVSKMNRNVYLSRPSPEFNDLKETAETIIKYEMKTFNLEKEKIKKAIIKRAEFVAKIYEKFKANQIKKFPHKNFHSLRDFYCLLKNIGKQMNQSNIFHIEQFIKVTMDSIFFNFSGYFFKTVKDNRVQKIFSYDGRRR